MRLFRPVVLSLLLSLSGAARAAVPTVTITGSVLTPSGGGAIQGTVHARLSQSGTALDGATPQKVAGSVLVNLTSAGALPAGFALVPNEAITPAGTYYEVTFTTRNPLGERQVWTEKWQFNTSPSTIAIGDVPRLDVIPGTAVAPVPLSGDLGGTYLAPEVRATHLASPLPETQGGSGAATLGQGQVTATGSTTSRALKDIARDVDGYTAASMQPLLSKLQREVEDATILVLGDSTGNETTEWVYQLGLILAARYPTHTVTYSLWNGTSYPAPTTLATGTGSRTLTIYNGSVSGSRTFYSLGGLWATMVAAITPDLVFINYGHNQNYSTGMWRSDYLSLTESLAEEHPGAGIVMILQNPNTTDTNQAQRNAVYEQIARDRGYGTINVWQAFKDYGASWSTDLMADTVHPNAAGSLLWANEAADAMRWSRKASPRPRSVSSFLVAGRQLAQNGDFAAWTAALPEPWLVWNGSPTVTKNTSQYEAPHGYAVQVTATGGSAGSITQALPVATVRGRWVTVLARVYVANGAPATAGVVALYDGTSTTSSAANGTGYTGGAFRWVVVSARISAGAASARVILYGDTSTTNGSAAFDSVSIVVGTLPMGLPRVTDSRAVYAPLAATAATPVWATQVTGQTYTAAYQTADGAFYFGPGTTPATKMIRYLGTGTLGIDSALVVAQAVTLSNTLNVAYALTTQRGRVIGRKNATGDTVLTNLDHMYTYTGSGGHTFTLPAANTNGQQHIIKNAGSGNVSVARAGSDTIDGSSTPLTLTPNEAVIVVCSSTANWEIVSRYP